MIYNILREIAEEIIENKECRSIVRRRIERIRERIIIELITIKNEIIMWNMRERVNRGRNYIMNVIKNMRIESIGYLINIYEEAKDNAWKMAGCYTACLEVMAKMNIMRGLKD